MVKGVSECQLAQRENGATSIRTEMFRLVPQLKIPMSSPRRESHEELDKSDMDMYQLRSQRKPAWVTHGSRSIWPHSCVLFAVFGILQTLTET